MAPARIKSAQRAATSVRLWAFCPDNETSGNSLSRFFNELCRPVARHILGTGIAAYPASRTGRVTMDSSVRNRLEQDLKAAVGRLRQMGATVAVEELPGAIGDNSPFADEVDEIQANESREIGFATRELLVARVNRLSAALDRLSEGEYGTCVECSEEISPARLRAMPEVQTCVRCQDRLERLGRQYEPEETEPAFDDE